MKKIVIIVGALALLGLVIFLVVQQASSPTTDQDDTSSTMTPTEDPLDVTLDFYNAWLEAELSTTTSPETADLLSHTTLSDPLRQTLRDSLTQEQLAVHPVLCQTSIPPRIGGKLSYVLDQQAEVHILARGLEERSARMAVVTLSAQAGKWVITGISCSNGETAPEREFAFDREGFLLKSVPPPLNAEYWHLVFEENGIMGHTAPLFFGATATCIAIDGSSATCDPDSFVEPTKVLVQGEITEAGVNVARVTALP